MNKSLKSYCDYTNTPGESCFINVYGNNYLLATAKIFLISEAVSELLQII